MKLRYLATVVVLVLTTVASHAQSQPQTQTQTQGNFGLYLDPIAIHVSNPVLDTSSFAFLGQQSTGRTFWGVDLGGYYDFFHSGKIDVGADLRGTDLRANNAALKELLIGIRVSGKPFTRPFRPYAQASIGGGYTKAPTSIVTVRKVDYRVAGGLDYTLQRHIDYRIIEVGYGSLETISSGTIGGGGDVAFPASHMLSFSTGLVFRF